MYKLEERNADKRQAKIGRKFPCPFFKFCVDRYEETIVQPRVYNISVWSGLDEMTYSAVLAN
jgi:hypothetical protein